MMKNTRRWEENEEDGEKIGREDGKRMMNKARRWEENEEDGEKKGRGREEDDKEGQKVRRGNGGKLGDDGMARKMR
jgi:hypothetical protein